MADSITNELAEKIITQIEEKIKRTEKNKRYAYSIVYPTELYNKNNDNPAVDIIIQHFKDAGYLIACINGEYAKFRIRWDRNKSYLTKGIKVKRNTNPKPKKEKPTKEKTLDIIISELTNAIYSKADRGYFINKYYSKPNRDKYDDICNYFESNGFTTHIRPNGLFTEWSTPKSQSAFGTLGYEMYNMATSRVLSIGNYTFDNMITLLNSMPISNLEGTEIFVGHLSPETVKYIKSKFSKLYNLELVYKPTKAKFVLQRRCQQ